MFPVEHFKKGGVDMAAHTLIKPKDGKALVFTSGQAEYGKDVDGFWKVNHPTLGVMVLNPAAVIENPDGTCKHQGQIMALGGAKGVFVNGTWTAQ